jgi:hypothetical protein
MPEKAKIPEKYQACINARNKYHLSHAHIQMARELGMNPKKFEKIANHKQEPWKAPLPVFIERSYFKQFGKTRPDNVKSIEQLARIQEKKKAERQKRKQLKRKEVGEVTGESSVPSH